MSRRWRFGRRALLWGSAIAVVAGAACYPGEIEGVGEVDLVVTAYDPGASFGSFATYVMPDTIIRVDAAGTDLPPAPDLDQQVLDAVATELAALGYVRLAPSSLAAPDVVVVLTVNVRRGPSLDRRVLVELLGLVRGLEPVVSLLGCRLGATVPMG